MARNAVASGPKHSTGECGLHAYFVHSYHLKAARPDLVLATTEYGGELTSIVAREIGAPAGTKPVEWRLLTNRAAPALADVMAPAAIEFT